jgi:hypothetical protein
MQNVLLAFIRLVFVGSLYFSSIAFLAGFWVTKVTLWHQAIEGLLLAMTLWNALRGAPFRACRAST